MNWADSFLNRTPEQASTNKKSRKKKRETQDDRIERKIKEYHMAKARTYFARLGVRIGAFALLVSTIGLFCNILVLLRVFGFLPQGG